MSSPMYFYVFHALVHALTISLFYGELFRQGFYRKMMQTVKNCELLPSIERKFPRNISWLIFVTHYFFLVVLSALAGLEPVELNNCSFQDTLRCNSKQLRSLKRFGIFSCTRMDDGEMSEDDKQVDVLQSSIELALGFLSLFISLTYVIIPSFRMLTFIDPVNTLHSTGNQFMTEVIIYNYVDS